MLLLHLRGHRVDVNVDSENADTETDRRMGERLGRGSTAPPATELRDSQ